MAHHVKKFSLLRNKLQILLVYVLYDAFYDVAYT